MQTDLKRLKYREATKEELTVMQIDLDRAKDPAGRLLVPAVGLLCLTVILNTFRLGKELRPALIFSAVLAVLCALFLLYRRSITGRYRKLVSEGKVRAVSAVCLERKKSSAANAASDNNMSRSLWLLSTEFGETVRLKQPVRFGVTIREGDRCLIASLDHRYHMLFGTNDIL